MSIYILKLKTGEDIVSIISFPTKTTIFLQYPISIFTSINTETRTQEYEMNYWLPVDLVKENYAIISKAEVVSLHEPTDEFKETYLGFLEETQSQKEIGEEDQDDFNNLLLSLTELKHSKVH